ncbi:MAG: hypothetical protein RIC16_05625 [Rhodospirillales bacterium]
MESEPIREIQFVYYLFAGLFAFFVAVLVRAFIKRRRKRDGE